MKMRVFTLLCVGLWIIFKGMRTFQSACRTLSQGFLSSQSSHPDTSWHSQQSHVIDLEISGHSKLFLVANRQPKCGPLTFSQQSLSQFLLCILWELLKCQEEWMWSASSVWNASSWQSTRQWCQDDDRVCIVQQSLPSVQGSACPKEKSKFR